MSQSNIPSERELERVDMYTTAKFLDISPATLQKWYRWYTNPKYDKPVNMPKLPPYVKLKHPRTGTLSKYWYNVDLPELAKFKEYLHGQGHGVMSKFHLEEQQYYKYKKIKEHGKYNRLYRERIEEIYKLIKAESDPVTMEMLERRQRKSNYLGFPSPKWIEFTKVFVQAGYTVYLYEAHKTVSKYIYLLKDDKAFKVRFSNHKPNFKKECQKDCDFFVGVSNLGVTTTADAFVAAFKYFGEDLIGDKIYG